MHELRLVAEDPTLQWPYFIADLNTGNIRALVKRLTTGCLTGTHAFRKTHKEVVLPWDKIPSWWPPIVRAIDLEGMTHCELLLVLNSWLTQVHEYAAAFKNPIEELTLVVE